MSEEKGKVLLTTTWCSSEKTQACVTCNNGKDRIVIVIESPLILVSNINSSMPLHTLVEMNDD